MSRETFFAAIAKSPVRSPLGASGKATINAVLDEWERRDDCTDLRWLADMLATMLGEVGQKMTPVREGFRKTDAESRAYVRAKGYAYARVINGHVYYGRGLPQITWEDNYRKMGKIIGVDLVNDPDKALEPDIAVKIMFEGMIRGTFTGKKLAHYFNEKTEDFDNARRIINGTDRMYEIGNYGRSFYSAIKQHLKFPHKEAPKPKMETSAKQEAVAITTPATGGVVAESTARSMEAAPKVDVGPDEVTTTLEGLQTQFSSFAVTGLRIFAIICAAITLAMAAYMIWKYAKVVWAWWKGEPV